MQKRFAQLFFLLLVFAVALSPQSVRAQAPQRIEITAKRFAFAPADITVKKGQPVVLVLKSLDVAHGIRFRELNVAVRVKAGGTAEVQFTPTQAGNFVGHCYVFCGSGHGSMSITLHVVG